MTDNTFRTEKYLRNRPFLLVTSKRRAEKHARTNVKGWGDTSVNWNNTERPEVVDRVNDRHIRDCTVIIDVINSKIVKNQLQNSDEEVVSHYLAKYQQYVAEAMDIWLHQLAKTVAQQTGSEIIANAQATKLENAEDTTAQNA